MKLIKLTGESCVLEHRRHKNEETKGDDGKKNYIFHRFHGQKQGDFLH